MRRSGLGEGHDALPSVRSWAARLASQLVAVESTM